MSDDTNVGMGMVYDTPDEKRIQQLERELAEAKAINKSNDEVLRSEVKLTADLKKQLAEKDKMVEVERCKDRRTIMYEIRELCLYAMFKLIDKEDKIKSAMDIESFKQRAKDMYIGANPDRNDIAYNLFHAQVECLVHGIWEAIWGVKTGEIKGTGMTKREVADIKKGLRKLQQVGGLNDNTKRDTANRCRMG